MNTLPILRNHYFYLVFWIVWFVTLWFLSNSPLPGPRIETEIPIDKILHWGYYGIGGAIATFFVLAWQKSPTLPAKYFEPLFFSGFLTGALDEWHQSWYEFRSGNDLGDFLADCLGTYCGIKCAQLIWKIFWREKG